MERHAMAMKIKEGQMEIMDWMTGKHHSAIMCLAWHEGK